MEKNEAVDFLVSLLLCFPQVSRAKIDSENDFLNLKFLIIPAITDKKLNQAKKKIEESLLVYQKFFRKNIPQITLKYGNYDNTTEISVSITLTGLKREFLEMIIELLETIIPGKVAKVSVQGKHTQHEHKYILNTLLEKNISIPESYYGFREAGRVMVFKAGN